MEAYTLSTMIADAKSLLGLFSEFPMNVLALGLVAGVAWRQIKNAKKAARG
jgi:hypothetical protein